MKNNKRKFISLLMAIVMAISMFSISASAVEVNTVEEPSNMFAVASFPSGDILMKGGNVTTTETINFTIPKNGKYVITIHCQPSGTSSGLSVMMQGPNGQHPFNKVISGQYQCTLNLTSGNWQLFLSSGSGSCAYGIIISSYK